MAAAALAAGAALLGCARGPSDATDASPDAAASGARRPNLLVVFTDDQRADTISALGPAAVETPHLDRLAAEGTAFTESFVTTSLCSPSRATLMTGKYVHVHGVLSNQEGADFLERHWSVARLLQDAGYATGFFGKWHVGTTSGAPRPEFDRWVSMDDKSGYWPREYATDAGPLVVQGPAHNTDVLTRLAAEWVAAPRAEPFFAVLSLKNPHRPLQPAPRHLAAVQDLPVALPDAAARLAEEPEFVRTVAETGRNAYFAEEGPAEDAYRRYLALVLGIDEAVGTLLAALEQAGHLDDTVVLFTSDNGYLWGEHGLFRKRATFEPSIRVPLIVRWPAEVPAGARQDELALNVDLAPTLLDLAGVDVPADAQGRSLRPLWRGDAAGWRERFAILDGYQDPERGPSELALRTRRWKYVRYRRPQLVERLFDLEADPAERTDLAAHPDQAARLADLRTALRDELRALDCPPGWWDD